MACSHDWHERAEHACPHARIQTSGQDACRCGAGHAGNRPGFEQIAQIAQGYSGLMSVTGTPKSGPVRVGVAIGDQTAGMWCAVGVLAAIAERNVRGKGRRVETSLLTGPAGMSAARKSSVHSQTGHSKKCSKRSKRSRSPPCVR